MSSSSTTAPDAAPAKTQRLHTEGYTSDLLSRNLTIVAIAAAWAGGAVFILGAWLVLRMTTWPAFNTSNMTYALSTAATVAVMVAVGGLIAWWLLDEQKAARRRKASYRTAVDFAEPEPGPDGNVTPVPVPALEISRPRWRVILTYLVAYLSPAALVVSTIAVPLSSTRLYLDGIQYDQGFRTQFLGRMTEVLGNHDMNYADMPSYYPLGWFWGGGRLANFLGMPGWEVYQPWALISMGAAACILVPVWQRLTGSLAVATAIALVSTSIMLVMSPEEPYGAIVAIGAPAAAIMARRALLGSWFASSAVLLYLGLSATMYTLFTGAVALSVTAIAAVFTALHAHNFVPVIRLFYIGIGSILIALISWGPYLWSVATGHPHSGSSAPHYLPPEATQIPLPFLSPTVIGLLCLIGLIYLVVRAYDYDVLSMGIVLLGFYLWSVASMITTLAGSTLLGFRIDILIVLVMATAGVLALAELRLVGVDWLYPDRFGAKARRTITMVMVLILSLGGLSYAQRIPQENQVGIDQAYTNTDGYGERADRFAPDAGKHYPAIDEKVRSMGYEPSDTVMLTDEIHLMAFNPYLGFQAFTSHYANPLGEFTERNKTIESWANGSWAELSDPQKFAASLDDAKWRKPDVFVFRGDLSHPESGWKTHIAEDIYPNNPNVRYRALLFSPAPFLRAPDLWDVSQIGPFVVAARVKS